MFYQRKISIEIIPWQRAAHFGFVDVTLRCGMRAINFVCCSFPTAAAAASVGARNTCAGAAVICITLNELTDVGPRRP